MFPSLEDMKTQHALARLNEHQQGILDHLEATEVIVRDGPQQIRGPLTRSRLEMFRLLRAYQLFKHGEIFDPLIREGNPAQIATAMRMKAECTSAGEAYRAYVNIWSSRDIVEAWESYRPAMNAMAARLRAHIARERLQVPELLAGSDRIRGFAFPAISRAG